MFGWFCVGYGWLDCCWFVVLMALGRCVLLVVGFWISWICCLGCYNMVFGSLLLVVRFG